MVDEAYLDRMLLDIYLCAFNILPVVYVCEEVYRRLYGLRHATGTMYRPYIMPKGGKTGGGRLRAPLHPFDPLVHRHDFFCFLTLSFQ